MQMSYKLDSIKVSSYKQEFMYLSLLLKYVNCNLKV